MKGYKDKEGKFHPITTYKPLRKSREQNKKTQGIRMKRDLTGNKLVFGTRREQVRPPQEILRMINHYRRGSIPQSKYQQEELDELYWAYNNGKGRTRDEIIFRESNYPSGYVSYRGIPDDPKAPEQVQRRLVLSWVLNRMVGGHNVRMKRESEFKQFLKNIDNHESYYLGRLDTILQDPKLEMTDDHVIARIKGKIGDPIFNYKIADKVRLKPNTEQSKEHGKIYWTEDLNTDITEKSLKRVADDARIRGLIPNNKISTLLDRAKFQTSDARYPNNLNQPVIISLKDTNYIIAPYNAEYAEFLQKEVMKRVVAEHVAEHERNQH